MNDHIHIQGCTIPTAVGCCSFEHLIQQPLVFGVWLWTDLRAAGVSDALEDTVDYAQVVAALQGCCQSQHHATLEGLAHRCAQHLLTHFPIDRLRLQIHKPHAVHAAQSIGVDITRDRSDVS